MAGEAESSWDVIVIGGGPAGENAAQYAIAGSDRSALIVESELVGGECSYWACMPSKALLRPVELHAALAGVPGSGGGQIDTAAVLKRRDAFTHDRDDASQVQWADDTGIDVLRGHGRLSGERRVQLTAPDGSARELSARHAVVLATGTAAAIPPVPGLAEALPWTSRDATNLVELPKRVAIIGGGVVACEAATWLRGLGAEKVTVINRGQRLLANNEPFAGELVAETFASRGVRVLSPAKVDSVSRPSAEDTGIGRIHGGPATLTLKGGEQFEVDELVVAAGRHPASGHLGLDAVGVTADDRGFVPTDDHLTVASTDWLYAVGDLNGRALLTHMGKYQARIAGAVIGARAEGRPLDPIRHIDRADAAAVTGVIFTDPQVASVGLTEQAARERNFQVQTLEYDLAAVAGSALLSDDYRGRAKLVVDAAHDTLIGATFVGSDVAELLHSATVAVVGQMTLGQLWHAVPAYPTVSEIWLRLLESRPAEAWR